MADFVDAFPAGDESDASNDDWDIEGSRNQNKVDLFLNVSLLNAVKTTWK